MSAPSGEGVEQNLTPILDMVFQLITFFMLVINFKGATMDLSLKLPVLGSARPLDYKGSKEPIMLNINSTGQVQAYNETWDVEKLITQQSRLLKQQLKSEGVELKDGELPVPILVRADKAVPFSTLNKVIKICQEHGFRQFSLSAMNSAEEG
jgi:biopolymer transport protein ExbD